MGEGGGQRIAATVRLNFRTLQGEAPLCAIKLPLSPDGPQGNEASRRKQVIQGSSSNTPPNPPRYSISGLRYSLRLSQSVLGPETQRYALGLKRHLIWIHESPRCRVSSNCILRGRGRHPARIAQGCAGTSRWNSMIQFVSQVFPASPENACCHLAELRVISDQT